MSDATANDGVPRAGVSDDHSVAEARLGEVLSGWRLDAVLGVGQAATVYACTDRGGNQGALRIVNYGHRSDAGVRRRMFREVRIARQLQHRGVTNVLTADVTGLGEPFVVMERLFGLDLKRMLLRLEGPMPLEAAFATFAYLTRIVRSCHQQGLVHRNLRPINVFVSDDGVPRMLDFGSALLADDDGDQTLAGLSTDRHAYLAPELRAGRLGDKRTDLFGLGQLLYAMLSGHVVDGAGVAPTLEDILPQLPELTRGRAAPVRRAIGEILTTTLAAEPNQRPDDTIALDEVLGPALESLGLVDITSVERAILDALDRVYEPDADIGVASRAWHSVELMRVLFEQVEMVLYTARRRGWGDDETTQRVEMLLNRILDAIEGDENGIYFNVEPHRFELSKRPVWEPRAPFDRIPYQLFDSGFRRIRLTRGLDRDECREFLRWLALDRTTDLPPEDDLATVFWRREFAHVRCDLVSSIVLQDVDDYDLLDRELQKIADDAVTELRESMSRRFEATDRGEDFDPTLLAMDDGEYGTVHRSIVQVLDPALVERVGATMKSELDNEAARIADVVARTYLDGLARGDDAIVVDAFREYVIDAENDERLDVALKVVARIARALDDVPRARLFAAPFQSVVTMRKLLDQVIPDADAVPEGYDVEATSNDLWVLLRHSDGGVFSSVIHALSRCTHKRLVAALEPYVTQHARGNEEEFELLLKYATGRAAGALLPARWLRPAPDSVKPTEAVFENRAAGARLDALVQLIDHAPRSAAAAFKRLLTDDDERVRRHALDLVVRGRLTAALPQLDARARSVKFHELSLAERGHIMRTALRLDTTKGEQLVVGLLRSEGAFSNRDRDATRVLAADVLGELGRSAEAVRELHALSTYRFWTGGPLKKHATEALQRMSERLGDEMPDEVG